MSDKVIKNFFKVRGGTVGHRIGIKLLESCVKANLRTEKCKNVKDARTRKNRPVGCVEIGLRKIH